ncbi:MAG: ABC transporter substrate-binding protein [Anaeromyxobacteraceae bacterium]
MRAPHLLALLLSLALPAVAHPESATEALKARDAEIRAALPPAGVEPSPAVRAKLESIVTRAVDLDGMVQKAMGKSWGQATPTQRKRIVGAFTKRFGALTGGQLDSYRSTDVAYGAEAPGAGGTTTVPTKVVVKGEPTEIAYALRKQGAGWRIRGRRDRRRLHGGGLPLLVREDHREGGHPGARDEAREGGGPEVHEARATALPEARAVPEAPRRGEAVAFDEIGVRRRA